MKLNSVPGNPLYSNPKVNRARKLVPKEVRRFHKGQAAPQVRKNVEAGKKDVAFSAKAEKILSAQEKVEIRKQFPAAEAQPVAYSRRGKMSAKPIGLGRKIDLKG